MSDLPPYFISFDQSGPLKSVLRGEKASNDLLWQIRDSAKGFVDEPLRFVCAYRTVAELPDVMVHNDLLIVSQRARDTLEPWLKDGEFFRVTVELSGFDDPQSIGGGALVEGYWWLNCWRRLDLVDWEKSEMALYPTPRSVHFPPASPLRATRWDSLVLNAPLAPDEHLFGVAFVRGERRYISPELHRHLLSAGIRAQFLPRFFRPPNDDIGARALRMQLNDRNAEG